MQLRYANTADDVAAFIRHVAGRSPTYRRNVRVVAGTVVFIGLVAGVTLFLVSGRWVALFSTALFVGIFLLIYFPLAARSLARTARGVAAEGPDPAVLCEHTLEITSPGLRERTPLSENLTAWTAIPKLEETLDHVFVYTQLHAAHVIPKGAVLEGDLAAFLAELRKRLPLVGAPRT